MVEKKKRYLTPKNRVVELRAVKIVCGSPDGGDTEKYDEEEYNPWLGA